jgi:hypothetical protein
MGQHQPMRAGSARQLSGRHGIQMLLVPGSPK